MREYSFSNAKKVTAEQKRHKTPAKRAKKQVKSQKQGKGIPVDNLFFDRLLKAGVVKEVDGKASFGEGDMKDPKFIEVVKLKRQLAKKEKQIAKKEAEIEKLKLRTEKVKIPGVALDSLMATEKTVNRMLKTDPYNQAGIKLLKDGFENIKLMVGEHRCLNAIFKLYSRRSYPEGWLVTCWSDFYRACGLKKKMTRLKRGEAKEALRFGSGEVREIKKTLENMEKRLVPIVFSYIEKDKKDKPESQNFIKIKEHLFRYGELYQNKLKSKEGVFEDLPSEIEKIKDYLPEKHYLIFKITKPLLHKHENYFKLVDGDFWERIKKVKKGGRVSKYDYWFYYFLIKQNEKKEKVEFNKEFLAQDVLKMSKQTLKDKQHRNRIILNLYKTFKKLGYLKSYFSDAPKSGGGFKDILFLNQVVLFKKEQLLLTGKPAENS